MSTPYPGVYRAQCVGVSGETITAYVPQVFADKRVPITNRTGNLPDSGAQGWVMFESALSSMPVWVSAGGTAPAAPAPAPVIPTIANLDFDAFILAQPDQVPIPDDTWIEIPITTYAELASGFTSVFSRGSSASRLILTLPPTRIITVAVEAKMTFPSVEVGGNVHLAMVSTTPGTPIVETDYPNAGYLSPLVPSSGPYQYSINAIFMLGEGGSQATNEYALGFRQKSGTDLVTSDGGGSPAGDGIFFTDGVVIAVIDSPLPFRTN